MAHGVSRSCFESGLSEYGGDQQCLDNKQGEPNRWVVHFVRKQPTPDSDFFILVDDATRKASLWHP